MGFLGSLIKTVAREATREATRQVVSKAVDSGVEKVQSSMKTDYSQNASTNTNTVPQTIPEITIKDFPAASNEVHYTTFDCSGNNDIEIDNTMQLPPEYREYYSGAAEIEYSAIYAPELGEDDDVDYDSNQSAMICVALAERPVENVIKSYEKNGTVPTGSELAKIIGSKYTYRVTTSFNGIKVHAYCYKNKPEDNYYYNVCLQYPERLTGSPLAQQLILHNIHAACTFTSKPKA